MNPDFKFEKICDTGWYMDGTGSYHYVIEGEEVPFEDFILWLKDVTKGDAKQ